MANINANFQNASGASALFAIVDLARDQNAPPQLFAGYLDPDQGTGDLTLYSADGLYGRVGVVRSGGAQTVVDVANGDTIRMS